MPFAKTERMRNLLAKATQYSHQLLAEIIQAGDTVIDATVGNGHDTIFLSRLVGEQGHVIGFDIQPVAIERTKQKIKEQSIQARVSLYPHGHETIASHLSADVIIKAAIFNLGYLPHGNKEIITKGHTTIEAIEQIRPRLVSEGRIVVVIYSGHTGGPAEQQAVLDYVQSLPQKYYDVLHYQFINQKNSPPSVLVIEKKAKE